MAKKYYAVRNGRVPGIYENWNDCRANVIGAKGAVYKSFPTREEAEAFMSCGEDYSLPESKAGDPAAKPECVIAENISSASAENNSGTSCEGMAYAFVDGSYQAVTGVYGFGGFLVHDGQKEILQGCGNDPDMASMRNVAGEILGSMAAVKKAVELQIPELIIYYDYMGIEMWASGAWKRNKAGTAAYYDYIRSVSDRIRLHFVKVKGHSGVEGNEEADRLAKEAVGNL